DRYGRSSDESARSIDPAGQLPDGREFAGIAGLKTLLAARVDQFARCLAEKLLAYSLGRTLGTADRPHVDHIVAEAGAKGYGLKDMVQLVVQSDPFQMQ